MGDREVFNQPEWGKKLSCCCLIPQRVVLAIMGFLCVVCCYLPNIGMAHAITVFTIQKPKNKTEEDASTLICHNNHEILSDTHKPVNKGDFHFNENEQGIILSAFYFGYILTHIPGGILADRYGGKWVLFTGLSVAMVVTGLTPAVAYLWRFYGLILIRFVLGVSEGVLYPALSSWLANWTPKSERGQLAGLVLGGNVLGTVMGNGLSGFILQHCRWPVLFYVYAVIIGIWLIGVFFLCSSYPVDHPCIQEKELEYLRQELGHIGRLDRSPTPWKEIFISVPVWAQILAEIGHDWFLYIMIVDLPKYMANVLDMTPSKNGFVTALPFICMWIVILISGWIGDACLKNDYMSLNNLRKLMTNIAGILPGGFLVLASYAGCNEVTVVVMFCLALGFTGCFYIGCKLTPIDMSPNNAGILMAISNGMGALTGFIAPIFIGFMTPNTTVFEWRVVFWTTYVILVISCIIFTIWGQSEIQPFDSLK